MKRMPLLLSFFALVALTASVTYWVIQFMPRAPQNFAAVAPTAPPPPPVDAAATLFGGQASAAVASNYQLTGVVAAGRNSAAIIVTDGTPKAIKLGKEVASGVTVQEVHPRYVMLSDGGVLKRIELAVDNKAASSGAPVSPLPGQQQFQPQQQPQQPQPQAQPQQPPVQVPPAAVPPPPPPAQMPAPMRGQVPNGGPAQLQ
jgi:general secretion pathway protein C